MYEGITFDVIMKRMLERVPDNLDKREGSVIYDALAPAAAELAIMYIQLDRCMDEAFADTASREYLVRRAAERGLFPHEATKAVIVGAFSPGEIDLTGERFNLHEYNYVVKEEYIPESPEELVNMRGLTPGYFNGVSYYLLECETGGVAGNIESGDLTPIDYIEGLEFARAVKVQAYGRDEEDTEVFRERYMASFSRFAFGGNIADYKNKVLEQDGVGAVYITPAWVSGQTGSVRVTILDSDYRQANSLLINTVQEKLDPETYEDLTGVSGQGYGLAPIGHKVTVDTPDEVCINTNITLVCEPGQDEDRVKSDIAAALDSYYHRLCKSWGKSPINIYTSRITAYLIENVEGITDVLVNSINRAELTMYEIPVAGEIVWTEQI